MPRRPSMPIAMQRSYFPPEDIARFHEAADEILAGRLSMGTWVERFEEAARRAHEVPHAIATSSCTAALEVALLAAGVKPGDAVIVPAETFIATGMAVMNIGAVPRFADIDPHTLCLAPGELDRLADSQVRAVIAVHFAGLIAPEIEVLASICRRHGWSLIEDAAHAPAARYRERGAGHFSRAACFSYYPTKVITAGEAGMIATCDEQLAGIARSYQSRGQDQNLPGEQFSLPWARNIRLPELSALLGVLQYGRLQEFVRQRRQITAVYDRVLADADRCQVSIPPAECFHNYWLYPVLLPADIDRERLKVLMKEQWQIDIAWSYFPPLHLMPIFRKHCGTRPGMLPVAEDRLARLVCLPVHSQLSVDDAACVAECFLACLEQLR